MAIMAIDGSKGHVFLITKGDNNNVTQSSNGVVIWAHGVANGNTFKFEGSVLQFLCPRNFALQSTFYEHIANQQILKLPPLTVATMRVTKGQNCDDYTLTKAITYHIDSGKHKGWLLNDIQQKLGTAGNDGGDLGEKLGYATYDHLEKFVKDGRSQLDIISIRNRHGSKGVTLQYVLNTLKNRGYAYGNIYCHHCRVSHAGKPTKDEIWDIKDTLKS
jgi:hypothetical protein